ncbi:hypothetical protein MP11Mi_00940 [Gordonia sp. MP11Mi]|uniref:Uncharacterized protein n=1 Tax=Gordonia sp. MP11Mi TaxID=3022769 RepID=A0AA97GSC1_9ACTN
MTTYVNFLPQSASRSTDQFAPETGTKVFFADRHSPRQRPTKEITNGVVASALGVAGICPVLLTSNRDDTHLLPNPLTPNPETDKPQRNLELHQFVDLGGEVLLVGAHSGISDLHRHEGT